MEANMSEQKQIELKNVLKKMIRSYAAEHGEMIFKVVKVKDQYLFSAANTKLLQAINLNEKDVVGSSIYNGRLPAEDMKYAYDIAFNGQEIFYYFFPPLASDIFLVVYCEPIFLNGSVVEIKGHCASLKNESDGIIGELLHYYKPFKLINPLPKEDKGEIKDN